VIAGIVCIFLRCGKTGLAKWIKYRFVNATILLSNGIAKMDTFLYRSLLYIPGSKERALVKAETLQVDAIIFDLEDAVAVEEKPAARQMLNAALARDYGHRKKIVRINGLDTQWGHDDATLIAGADAVLIPKVNTPADIDAVAALGPGLPLWAMMETPAGILNAAAIAGHPAIGGLVLGTNDLAKDLNCRARADRQPLLTGLQMCVLAAKAHGRIVIDGVYNAFRDEEGLTAECEQGRDMGFDGKTLIHPAQLAVANAAFAPSNAEVDLAHRQIEAFEAAEAAGQGVAVVDGKIVENLHIVTATRILSRARAISALEG
jgi:(3S)-malyl-CoA thioesterase